LGTTNADGFIGRERERERGVWREEREEGEEGFRLIEERSRCVSIV